MVGMRFMPPNIAFGYSLNSFLVRKKLNNALPSLISVELMETCLGFWLHPKEVQLDFQFYTQSQKGTFRANLEFKLFSILLPPGAL